MGDAWRPVTDADKNGRQYLVSSDGGTVWIAHWNKYTRTWATGAVAWPEEMVTKCIPIEYPQREAESNA